MIDTASVWINWKFAKFAQKKPSKMKSVIVAVVLAATFFYIGAAAQDCDKSCNGVCYYDEKECPGRVQCIGTVPGCPDDCMGCTCCNHPRNCTCENDCCLKCTEECNQSQKRPCGMTQDPTTGVCSPGDKCVCC